MKTLLSILTILLGLTGFVAYGQSDSTKASNEEQFITLQVEGMSCKFCAMGLKNSLEKLENIKIHEIDPRKGVARLSFERNKIPADTTLKKRVEVAGFKLTNIKRNDQSGSDDGPEQ